MEIRVVCADREVADLVAVRLVRALAGPDRRLESLTAREQDVLRCLGLGMTRMEIAVRLVVSVHTVRTHVRNILRKLEVESAVAAVSLWREACAPRHRTQ